MPASEMSTRRYAATGSGGGTHDKPFAVIDKHDVQQGRGYRRVSHHRTWREATAAAKRRNEALRKFSVHVNGGGHRTGPRSIMITVTAGSAQEAIADAASRGFEVIRAIEVPR